MVFDVNLSIITSDCNFLTLLDNRDKLNKVKRMLKLNLNEKVLPHTSHKNSSKNNLAVRMHLCNDKIDLKGLI